MDFRSFIKGMILFIPLLLASCNDEGSASLENKCKIVCSVDGFESVNPSRTNADPNDFSSITWASGDVIGIFPLEGYQEPFEIPIDQIGKKSASFDGGYWDVKDGLLYNAYYPFDKRNFDSAEMKTRIPVTYIGQKQNGSSCDIGAFDYTYSDWNTAANGSISFDFHHIGAIGVFSLEYPATTTYTKMTLSVDEALIPLNGCYDLTANDVSMVPDENSLSTSIDLELTNCSGVAGETGVFYMMLPPMDLSSAEVTLSLTSAAGTACTYSIEKTMNVKKGKLYRRTGIPTKSKVEGTVDGWGEDEENDTPYVTFTAENPKGFKMTLDENISTLQYSVDNGDWQDIVSDSYVTFGGEYGELRLRGNSLLGTGKSRIEFAGNSSDLVSCTGDIRTLIDYANYTNVSTSNAIFSHLFYECEELTTAPELPSMELAESCYIGMFWACRNLVNAPNLPATKLAKKCYYNMFVGCEKLTAAPEISAITVAEESCVQMFSYCTSLTTVPDFHATELAEWCFNAMFMRCSSLVKAPLLPAQTLAPYCYAVMFVGCTSLSEVTMLATDISAENCLASWVDGVSSTGIFTKASSMNSLTSGASGVPEGWTVVNK